MTYKFKDIHDHVKAECWEKAFGLAVKLHHATPEMERAHAVIRNADFYRQIGRDVDQITKAGKNSLIEVFTPFWEAQ